MQNILDEHRKQLVEKIKQSQLVAIIRLTTQQDVANVVDCLVNGGVTSLEITANTPGYCAEITKARDKHPTTIVGAGTVINVERAQEAIEAGAQFIVTPNTHEEVVEYAHNHGVPVLMGVLTPTDIARAISFGADLIKLFPAGSMGIKYFKDLQGPFSDVPLMPVGGVNINNISDWFNAGAIGVGVGNDLTRAAKTYKEKTALTKLVKRYVQKLPNTNEVKIPPKNYNEQYNEKSNA